VRYWLILILISSSACSVMEAESPLKERWMPYEQVNVRLRRKLEMRPDQFILSCRNVISSSRLETAESLRPGVERIIVADVTSHYYDNRTGQLLASCGYWFCSKHQLYCKSSCPPRAWTCTDVDQADPSAGDDEQ